jgi:phytoene/squalene synthetase
MRLYDRVSADVSRLITRSYSSSFSLAIGLLPRNKRLHIYNLYGLVRIADEVVDTYRGKDARAMLDELEQETYSAFGRGYSTNPAVHAFVLTAREHAVGSDLVKPFFQSMRTDITKRRYKQTELDTYIYGSAEVVGLMCLHVFCKDAEGYDALAEGARRLGSAFQKINFLRDLQADATELGRVYFPGVNPETFDEAAKQRIIAEIRAELAVALPYANRLPKQARPAVMALYRYYTKLLRKIERAPVEDLKSRRMRLGMARKLHILAVSKLSEKLRVGKNDAI